MKIIKKWKLAETSDGWVQMNKIVKSHTMKINLKKSKIFPDKYCVSKVLIVPENIK